VPHYIKEYIAAFTQKPGPLPPQFFQELYEELRRFDPRDFDPAVQALLVQSRYSLRFATESMKGAHSQQMKTVLAQIIQVFENFRGQGSGGIRRTFSFIADAALRQIVERDYAELTLKLFPDGAWKSSVIMAGSILEAILFDRVADAKWNSTALASAKVPLEKKTNSKRPMDEWTLENLIDIAVDINLLPKDPANTIHQVLRDYRNFVHPKKEIRAAHACTEAEAMLAVGALNSVCNYLDPHP
jgi:hypothetical protein